jgi:hypothetical protein
MAKATIVREQRRNLSERKSFTDPAGIAIVKAAEEHGVTLRLMGGLAVALHCHLLHSEHMRSYHDIDLFGLSKEYKGIHLVLEKMGYSPKKEFNDLRGTERLMFFDKDNCDIDVFIDKFRMNHVIDFRERLHLDSLTIPLTDLFLTKVQNTKLAAKDVTDTIALLEDHALGYADDQEVLNLSYIAELCSDD